MIEIIYFSYALKNHRSFARNAISATARLSAPGENGENLLYAATEIRSLAFFSLYEIGSFAETEMPAR
ncbi:hypothetical protein RBI21_00025 (plasmid) [Klebsiella pneumoniae]|nr:hypothetical protein RBI21_00025 [Klebsiella pneumoniae]